MIHREDWNKMGIVAKAKAIDRDAVKRHEVAETNVTRWTRRTRDAKRGFTDSQQLLGNAAPIESVGAVGECEENLANAKKRLEQTAIEVATTRALSTFVIAGSNLQHAKRREQEAGVLVNHAQGLVVEKPGLPVSVGRREDLARAERDLEKVAANVAAAEKRADSVRGEWLEQLEVYKASGLVNGTDGFAEMLSELLCDLDAAA